MMPRMGERFISELSWEEQLGIKSVCSREDPMTTRMNVTETERTLVERAREVEKLRDKATRIKADLAATEKALQEAQDALVDAAVRKAAPMPELSTTGV